jgi:hypothetical protein
MSFWAQQEKKLSFTFATVVERPLPLIARRRISPSEAGTLQSVVQF